MVSALSQCMEHTIAQNLFICSTNFGCLVAYIMAEKMINDTPFLELGHWTLLTESGEEMTIEDLARQNNVRNVEDIEPRIVEIIHGHFAEAYKARYPRS